MNIRMNAYVNFFAIYRQAEEILSSLQKEEAYVDFLRKRYSKEVANVAKNGSQSSSEIWQYNHKKELEQMVREVNRKFRKHRDRITQENEKITENYQKLTDYIIKVKKEKEKKHQEDKNASEQRFKDTLNIIQRAHESMVAELKDDY